MSEWDEADYRAQAEADTEALRSSLVQQARESHARIVAEAMDLCWKATPYGVTEDGVIRSYLLPTGVVHRLLGALQGAGYPAAFRNPNATNDAQEQAR